MAHRALAAHNTSPQPTLRFCVPPPPSRTAPLPFNPEPRAPTKRPPPAHHLPDLLIRVTFTSTPQTKPPNHLASHPDPPPLLFFNTTPRKSRFTTPRIS